MFIGGASCGGRRSAGKRGTGIYADQRSCEKTRRREQVWDDLEWYELLAEALRQSIPHYHQQRQEFIGDARTWEDLDTPIWKKEEGEEEEWGAVEAYFAYLYRPLAGR
ncbi:hypothetical protein EV426DRAFT_707313 [Tirmania nivea]|nr:hypothetical protein EV426DRAFT_707313 [Tirmania nivea]